MTDLQSPPGPPPTVAVEQIENLRAGDLSDLCDAAEAAIEDGGGFGWVRPPERDSMERFWRGVLAVPYRALFVARLDGVIVGSIQLVRPPPNNEAQAFAATLTSAFVAPWARGHGLARMLVETAEAAAIDEGFEALYCDLRETQTAAIHMYENLGYRRWGENPAYARVDGRMLRGYYFCKMLEQNGRK